MEIFKVQRVYTVISKVIASAVMFAVLAFASRAQSAELTRFLLEFNYPAFSGKSYHVDSNDKLHRALNKAERGDEIVLAAGARF